MQKGKKNSMKANLFAQVNPELKQLVDETAIKAGVPTNEWIAKVLAESLGRPDLAAIPRKCMGRPRKAAISA